MESKYTVDLHYAISDFEFMVRTNYRFGAASEEAAKILAEQIEVKLENHLLSVYYDKEKRSIIIQVQENEYFTEVEATGFTFYDETKGPYLKLDFEDNASFYPVANEICLTPVTKEEFMDLIDSTHKDYFAQTHEQILSFDAISYKLILLDQHTAS